MRQLNLLKRITLVKYIHRWLATKKRRHRESRSPDNTCPLCGLVETRDHMFKCQHIRVKELHDKAWSKLLTDVVHNTATDFSAIFRCGMQTIVDGEHPLEAPIQEWPSNLTSAFITQTAIGWEQVLFGRLAVQTVTVTHGRGNGLIDPCSWLGILGWSCGPQETH